VDDLRWILLLVGAIVVVAIYFSGRFENEEWTRERKQVSKKKAGSTSKKLRRKRSQTEQVKMSSANEVIIKKEPRMYAQEVELVTEPSEKQEKNSEPPVSEPQSDVVATSSVSSAKNTSVVDSVEVTLGTTVDEVPVETETVKTKHNDIEDEITEIEIPVDLETAEAEIQISEVEENMEPIAAEEALSIKPLVLSVTVLANEDEFFNGPEIKEALEAEDLTHGEMQIFHFHERGKEAVSGNGDAVFSVANMLEPGIFDIEKLDGMQTPGLMLFCQLPGPLEGEDALELMLDKGRGLAVRLHGQMCDDKRNLFTTQAKNHYLDRIAVFSRELVLARSKMPIN